ncbi:MAG TPA: thioredoxin domain-containing protein [Armatimonadetes bacterium]|nr:thioredoxin domain-containing protein [Armatimonadota bacterium]
MEPRPDAAPNRLARESSPYLLQHAHNPVDWYPWGDEAFAAAVEQDKPIFLSIGYSTCHWCHVMAHESFEDTEVAALLNETFINIKLDREERPDIDSVYMGVCQALTGSGGWPLTIIMTPEKKPFFAATYIPREARFGRPGMLELIPRIAELWGTQRDRLLSSADEITEAMQTVAPADAGRDIGRPVLERGCTQLQTRYDPRHGGFSDAPKFPTPHTMMFLLRHWSRTGEQKALEMVEKTLLEMADGGIHDQLGSGFHRYSTDERWLVPHFEKMLYDQAMLTMAYTEAWQATGETRYREVAEQVIEYVLRDMTSPEGGFYSAEDADSEGEEGKFYVWTQEQIREVLDPAEVDLVTAAYTVRAEGNFADEATGVRTGANILHLTRSPDKLAAEAGVPVDEWRSRLAQARAKLLEARGRRVRPGLDDKILVSWNGLMVAALAKAAFAFDNPGCAATAARCVEFALGRMRDERGRLLHRYRAGEAGIAAHLDDYAFLIWGLLELYGATFEPRHLAAAIELNDRLMAHFHDADSGGFFFTADDAEQLLTREKLIYDGAMPSGNSVQMLNLLRLGRITGQAEYEQVAHRLARAFSEPVDVSPAAHCMLLCAVDFALGLTQEVVIAGDPAAEDTQAMLAPLRSAFVPAAVVLLKSPGGETPPMSEIAPFTADYAPVSGRATAYVCTNNTCEMPTTDVVRFREQLNLPAP